MGDWEIESWRITQIKGALFWDRALSFAVLLTYDPKITSLVLYQLT